jgi:hypothetical protein
MWSALLQETFEFDSRGMDFTFSLPYFGEYGFMSLPTTFWIKMSVVSSKESEMVTFMPFARLSCSLLLSFPCPHAATIHWLDMQFIDGRPDILLYCQKAKLSHSFVSCIWNCCSCFLASSVLSCAAAGHSKFSYDFFLACNWTLDAVSLF